MQIKDVFGKLPLLETERTKLRPVTLQDVEDMYRYCSDEAVAEYTSWNPHGTLDDTLGFIRHLERKYDSGEVAPWGVVDKEENRLIGTCGFVHWDPVHRRAELGYALSRRYWGKGYMTEVAAAIIQFGFTEMDLIRLEARCLVPNIGSARVMEKTGMTYEGTLRKVVLNKGVHCDLKVYSIVKGEDGSKRL
jgi:ribosomal-protein-alanine N-acetyltransferase